jgi:hypothetical protein
VDVGTEYGVHAMQLYTPSRKDHLRASPIVGMHLGKVPDAEAPLVAHHRAARQEEERVG